MIEFLAVILRAEAHAWPAGLTAEDFLEEAALHGAQGLLHDCLEKSGAFLPAGAPHEIVPMLSRWTRHEAACELLAQDRIAALLREFAKRDVPCLILKGTALAYSLYRHPHQRPRGDTDLLVPESHRDAAREAITSLGYEFPDAIGGRLISSQASAVLTDRHGMQHCVDLHWRLNNAQGFAAAFDFDELRSRAVPVPALAPGAWGSCPVDALLIACMHRVAHRYAPYRMGDREHFGDRLIWLYDIHLLAQGLDKAGWQELAERATAKGLRAVCREALLRTSELLATDIPAGALETLGGGSEEIPAGYLAGGRLRWLLTDLRALPGLPGRLRLLAEHAFPPASYMRNRYRLRSPLWLPGLYLYRGLRGAWRLVRG